MIAEARRLAMPFTTGILIGIGETRAERIESLLVIKACISGHGHIQEVIVQNFLAKARTPNGWRARRRPSRSCCGLPLPRG